MVCALHLSNAVSLYNLLKKAPTILIPCGWVRLQNLPADEIPTCGPGLDYMLDNFPLGEALRMVFEGSGECAEVAWSFLGLSMPGWVFLWAVGLGAVGVWNNLRRE